jgi:hypothetical protein
LIPDIAIFANASEITGLVAMSLHMIILTQHRADLLILWIGNYFKDVNRTLIDLDTHQFFNLALTDANVLPLRF